LRLTRGEGVRSNLADAKESANLTPPVEDVVVDVPGWQQVRPRIPDTQQRRTLERRRSIREIVFGMQDGILTTLGIITGVGVAEGARAAVFISGFLALLAGALSMGVGEYLGRKSEREVVAATIDMEKREMAADPQGEFAEQVAYYKLKGFSAEEAEMIVRRLTQLPDIYLYEMVRDEFGIDPREAEATGIHGPLAMSGSFALGSLLPILAFMLPLSMFVSTLTSLLFALIGLFGVGYYAGTLSERNPIGKGLEVALYGCAVFVLSYLAGHFIPPLFGHAPVPVGG
jgi:vacuolar iron transporter family protein